MIKMQGRKAALLLVAAILIAMALAWWPRPGPPTRESVRVVAIPHTSYAPIFIALEEGFFADAGLDVEFYSVSRSDAAIPPLVHGDIDVVPAAIMPSYFNMISRGAMMRVVAGKGYFDTTACPYTAIMARRDLLDSGALTAIADVRGRTVSADRSSPFYFGMNRFLALGHLTLDDVNSIDLPPAARFEAFRKGSVDVASVTEPWITRALRDGHAKIWMKSSELLPDFQYGFLLFGKSLLLDRPEIGEKFMVAYLRAVRQLNADGKSKRNVEIMAKHTDLDEELLRETCWPAFRNDARVQPADLEAYQAWALKEGLIGEVLPEERVYEPRFIEYANRVIDRIDSGQP